MNKTKKWLGIGLGVVVGLLVLVAGIGFVRGKSALVKEWDYEPASITIPTDAASIETGEYLVNHFMLCSDCHGQDLGGAEFFTEEEGLGVLWAPNLTSGEGGIGSTYSDEDWLRALRHGIRPNGENLIVMPAEFYTMVDAVEIAQSIAYLKVMPAVDRVTPPREMNMMFNILLGLGVVPFEEIIPAYKLDHTAPLRIAPEKSVSLEYGAYRAEVCSACHGANFSGVSADDSQGGGVDAPNLTPGGHIGSWTFEDFTSTLQSGLTPEGKQLDNSYMPWARIGSADRADLEAIWLYLQSLPPLPDFSN